MVGLGTLSQGPFLIADDNPDDAFLLRRRLRESGVRAPVHEFRDGRAVMEFLVTLPPDSAAPCILFLDINMPASTGFSVLCWLREKSGFENLPVVIVSGSDDPADIALASSLGADAYLPKTTELSTLGDILAKLSRSSRSAPPFRLPEFVTVGAP